MVGGLKVCQVDGDRDGRYWHIRVPEVARSTQARTLREIEPMARDLIAVMEDVDPTSCAVEIHISLPEDVSQELEAAASLREKAAGAQAETARRYRHAARRRHEPAPPVRALRKV